MFDETGIAGSPATGNLALKHVGNASGCDTLEYQICDTNLFRSTAPATINTTQ